VYLAFLAGLLAISGDKIFDASQSDYTRLAATVSFISFLIGYDPSRFQDLLGIGPQIITGQNSKAQIKDDSKKSNS
jgi:hypothetical protein